KNADINSKAGIHSNRLFDEGDFEDGSPYKVFGDTFQDRIDTFNLFDFSGNLFDNPMYDGMEKVYLGHFKLTAYDACIQCCGKTDGITASGTRAKSGRTIAVDKSLIPLGSKVVIAGHVYIAEDTGSDIRGNWIDVFMDTHEIAKRFGVQYEDVYLLR
nr:3D domain-containing protein [Lachnospiraceae bacterium]